jgi:hypothetical protein
MGAVNVTRLSRGDLNSRQNVTYVGGHALIKINAIIFPPLVEIWKTVVEWETLYEVSNCGRRLIT